MYTKEIYTVISQLREEINSELVRENLDIKKIVLKYWELPIFKEVCEKDTQLYYFKCGMYLWQLENEQCAEYGMRSTIFDRVKSLRDLEYKFLFLRKGILRFETPMPEMYYEEVIDYIIQEEISFLFCLWVITEREDWEDIIIKVSKLLRNKRQHAFSIILLEKAIEYNFESEKICLELANCWMDGEQWERAYKSLKRMGSSKEEVQILMRKLEEMIGNEKI